VSPFLSISFIARGERVRARPRSAYRSLGANCAARLTRRADNGNLRERGRRCISGCLTADRALRGPISLWVDACPNNFRYPGERGADKTVTRITNESAPLLRSRRFFSRYERPRVGECSRPPRDCGSRRLYPAYDSFHPVYRSRTHVAVHFTFPYGGVEMRKVSAAVISDAGQSFPFLAPCRLSILRSSRD